MGEPRAGNGRCRPEPMPQGVLRRVETTCAPCMSDAVVVSQKSARSPRAGAAAVSATSGLHGHIWSAPRPRGATWPSPVAAALSAPLRGRSFRPGSVRPHLPHPLLLKPRRNARLRPALAETKNRTEPNAATGRPGSGLGRWIRPWRSGSLAGPERSSVRVERLVDGGRLVTSSSTSRGGRHGRHGGLEGGPPVFRPSSRPHPLAMLLLPQRCTTGAANPVPEWTAGMLRPARIAGTSAEHPPTST